MGLKLDHLPPAVASRLRAYHRRKRFYELLRIAIATSLLYATLAIAAMHADRFLFLDAATRSNLTWTANAIAAIFAAVSLLVFTLRRADAREIAYELESRLPDATHEYFTTLENVGAKQSGDNAVRKELMEQLERSAVAYSERVSAGGLVRDRALRVLAVVLVLYAGGFAALATMESYEFPLMAERFLFPSRNLPKPSFVKLKLEPGDTAVGKGGEVVIQAESSGRLPDLVAWLMQRMGAQTQACEIALGDGSAPFVFENAERHEMSRVQRNLFVFTKGELEKGFGYRVRYGDAETRTCSVEVVAQPVLQDVKLTVTPPEYSKLPPTVITDVRKPIRLLAKTKVKLAFRADQPLAERSLLFEGKAEPVEPEWNAETREGSYEFELKSKVAFEIRAVNEKKFANVERTKIAIDLREDLPPSVQMEFPLGDLEAVAAELIPIRAAIEDDLSVESLALRFRLNPNPDEDQPPKEIPLPLDKAAKNVPLSASLDLEKTGAVPGDVVAIRLRAKDSAANYGESREIMVRVIPFTRGENERLRIVALNIVGQALKIAAEADPETDPLKISKAAYDQIVKLAKDAGVTLAPDASLQSLLDLLEREHHFTDTPRHKNDLRLLSLALSSAVRAKDPEAALKTLATQTIPALSSYRRLKNIFWRFWGMRYEALNIQKRLEELAAQENAPADQKESIKKRAALYQKTLEAIGVELLEWSRTETTLDEKKIQPLFGELNTTARFMSSGPSKKRQENCALAEKLIVDLLNAIRPALPKLFEAERKAREALEAEYLAALQKIAAGAQQADFAEWLALDARLLERDAFAPYWSRLRNDALVARAAPEKLFKQNAAVALMTQSEQHLLQRIALEWELASIRGLERVSNAEKLFETLLLQAEFSATPAEAFAKIEAFDLKFAVSDAELDAAGVVAGDSAATLVQTQEALERAAAELIPAIPVTSELQTLATALKSSVASADDLERALKTGEADKAAPLLSSFVAAMASDRERVRAVISRLYLRRACQLPESAANEAEEILLLNLREQIERYESRLAGPLDAIRQGVGVKLGAQEMSSVGTAFEQARGQQRSLLTVVEKVQAAYAQGTLANEVSRAKYAALKPIARIRAYVGMAAEASSGKASAAAVGKFMADFPECGRVYLSAQSMQASALKKSLSMAVEKLGTPPALPEFEKTVESAQQLARKIDAAAQQAGAGELQEKVKAIAGKLITGAAQLKPEAGKPTDEAWVKRKLYDLNEMLKQAKTLEGELRTAALSDGEFEDGLQGGPAGIWSPETRYQAGKSRERLVQQAAFARQQAILGILSVLQKGRDQKAADRGLAWAMLQNRLIHSSLYGVGGLRTQGGGDAQKGDPHLRFLKAELEKARQVKSLKHYGGPTKEYLNSLSDFLRY